MFRRLIIISGFLLFLLIAAAAWNIHQAGKPMNADEIPQWELVQETQDSIFLQSVAEPDRKTEAFLEGKEIISDVISNAKYASSFENGV